MKYIFLLSVFCTLPLLAVAQIDSILKTLLPTTFSKNNIESTTDEYVSLTTAGAVYFLRQDYSLKGNSGKLYGLSNKDYFGRTTAMAVAAGGKLYTFAAVTKPWIKDENYGGLEKEDLDTLKPILNAPFLLRIMGDSLRLTDGYKYDTLKNGLANIGKMEQTLSLASFPLKGERNKRIRLIIYYTEQSNEQNPKVKALSIPVDPVSDTKDGVEVKFDWKGKEGMVLGGVYYIETFSLGKMEIAAAALLEPTGPGKGKVLRLNNSKIAPTVVEPDKDGASKGKGKG